MTEAYNFIAAWQLFPEKGRYEKGERPKSGIYKIETGNNKNEIIVSSNWYTLQNEALGFTYHLTADGQLHRFPDIDFADSVQAVFENTLNFFVRFFKNDKAVLHVQHQLQPNGFMKITQQGSIVEGESYCNTEIYHKQMSVVPYATAASGALIRPTEQGIIRHKALSAMEEQTNMQLDQIRRQIELLAIQAQEIQMRKELSMIIYDAKLSFKPVIGNTYFLFQKKDGTHVLSLISPAEYGGGAGPYQVFVASVKLLADHTWVEVPG
jgi:hypothetical protein